MTVLRSLVPVPPDTFAWRSVKRFTIKGGEKGNRWDDEYRRVLSLALIEDEGGEQALVPVVWSMDQTAWRPPLRVPSDDEDEDAWAIVEGCADSDLPCFKEDAGMCDHVHRGLFEAEPTHGEEQSKA